MSDETEMNPEMESFAESLRNVPAPNAKIDRDQLMYDAGWAAAVTNSQPKVTVGNRGFKSMAFSFAGGLAVATAVMLSVVPFSGDAVSTIGSREEVASSKPNGATEIPTIETPATDIATTNSDEPDLLEWIENLPPGRSINPRFSSSPVLASIATRDQRSTTRRQTKQKTSRQLFRELMPEVSTRPSNPTWSTWLIPGT